MAWSNPSTRAAGAVLTATIWNQDVVANTEFLAKPPSVSLTRTTEQSIATSAWRSISWNTESWDTDSMWSSTAATRVDINTAGKYLITAQAEFDTSTAGTGRVMGLTVGGTSTSPPSIGRFTAMVGKAGPAGVSIQRLVELTSTQSVRVQVWQDSGSALNLVHGTQQVPSLGVLWVSS